MGETRGSVFDNSCMKTGAFFMPRNTTEETAVQNTAGGTHVTE